MLKANTLNLKCPKIQKIEIKQGSYEMSTNLSNEDIPPELERLIEENTDIHFAAADKIRKAFAEVFEKDDHKFSKASGVAFGFENCLVDVVGKVEATKQIEGMLESISMMADED